MCLLVCIGAVYVSARLCLSACLRVVCLCACMPARAGVPLVSSVCACVRASSLTALSQLGQSGLFGLDANFVRLSEMIDCCLVRMSKVPTTTIFDFIWVRPNCQS